MAGIGGVWCSGKHSDQFRIAGQFLPVPFAVIEGGPIFGTNLADASFHRSDSLSVVADAALDDRHGLAASLGVDALDGDAQLIAHAYCKRGLSFLETLDGEFAFALHDRVKGTLILGRDAAGRRPLFFCNRPQGVAFASSALPLAALDGSPSADPIRLAAYQLREPERGPRSFYRGVERVLPGHYAIIERDRAPAQRQWWKPQLEPLMQSEEEIVADLDRELERAVRPIVDGHSPLAAQLTSGLDSSLAVATASRLLAPGQKMVAITGVAGDGSVGPKRRGRLFDESEAAARTAAMLGNIEHRRVVGPTRSPLAAFESILPSLQQPVRNVISISWIEATYAAARETGSSILLEGSFGNYTVSWIAESHLAFLVRHRRWREALAFLRTHRRVTGGSGLGLIAEVPFQLSPPWLADGAAWLCGKPSVAAHNYLNPRHEATVEAVRDLRARRIPTRARRRPDWGPEGRLANHSLFDNGSHRAMVYNRYGLRLRDPFAARRMLERTLRIEESAFVSDGRQRRIARAMLQGRVPPEVADYRLAGVQATDWPQATAMAVPAMNEEIELAMANPMLGSLFDWQRVRKRLAALDKGAGGTVHARDVWQAMSAVIIARFVRWVDETGPQDWRL